MHFFLILYFIINIVNLFMDRRFSIYNRLVVDKIQKKNFDMHLKRLQRIKSSQTKKKLIANNILLNSKGHRIEEQNQKEIQKENVILLNKMNKIMHRPSQSKLNLSTHSLYKTSMNYQNPNDKIFQENKLILQRIQNQKPSINSKKLHQQRIKHQKILKTISRYPHKYSNHSTVKASQTIHNHFDDYQQQQFLYQLSKPMHSIKQNQQSKNVDSPTPKQKKQNTSQKNTETSQMIKSINSKEHKQVITLYKIRKIMQGHHFQLQINRLYDSYQFKLIHLQSHKIFSFILNEIQGNSLFQKYDYDYNLISRYLRIRNDSLVLELEKNDVKIHVNKQIQQHKNFKSSQLKQVIFNEEKLINNRLKSINLMQTNQKQMFQSLEFPQKPCLINIKEQQAAIEQTYRLDNNIQKESQQIVTEISKLKKEQQNITVFYEVLEKQLEF